MIATGRMMKRRGGLNQALIERPRIPRRRLPQSLPDFVRLEKSALIEQPDAKQKLIVHEVFHASILPPSLLDA